jgi:lipoprotein-anchoring transpeptidase ErfK/SrfK
VLQKFANLANYAHNTDYFSITCDYIMRTPTLLDSPNKSSTRYALSAAVRAAMLSSVCLLAGVSTGAIAAPNASERTLPVRNVDSMPNLAKLASLKIDENHSTSLGTNSNTSSTMGAAKPKPAGDRMGQLIENKSQPAATVDPDNISAAELTRQDELKDASDDIEEGQAVASPDDAGVADPFNNTQTDNTSLASAAGDTSIKSIEDKDGKKITTLDLSSYAQTVNSSTWSPNMKVNSAMTIRMQALLDWNHASPGPIDGGWGMNSKKALINFQNMHGLPATGKMDKKTWDALNKNISPDRPVLVTYTLTDEDVKSTFAATPNGSEAKSKVKGLYYQDIKEMLGERFHMDVRYLDKLNKNKSYKAGDKITVVNVRPPLKQTITRVVANKADKTLYAYNGDKLVATYPTTVGSSATPSPHGTFKIVNKVKMPWYKATVGEDKNKQVFMLPPGPNNPVGVVWMGLSKPSYGIHGSPMPEGISRQGSHGCIRLTNWDVLEVYANIENGATVELK